MFHPVGSQPPSVYWRRRLLAAGSLIILVVLVAVTISALTSGGPGSPSAGAAGTRLAARGSSSTPAPRSSATHRVAPPTSTARSKDAAPSSPTKTAASTSVPSSPVVAKCVSSDLQVAAVVGQPAYRVGQKPMVELKVTNVGSAPCIQDLADKQVVLKVYNGVSRVWGSHDCQIQPGTKQRTLAVGAPVLVSVSWSGETSQPHCAGTRQHVGAGTYTLYATLSGKTGTAARFTIS